VVQTNGLGLSFRVSIRAWVSALNVEVGRERAVERREELVELDRAVTAVQRGDDLAGGEVQLLSDAAHHRLASAG